MRRIPLAAVLAALLLPTAPLAAQDGPISMSIVQFVAPSQMDDYEEAMRRHNEWHAQQNDPWPWLTYQSLTGRAGRYVTLTSGHEWSDFDSPPVSMTDDEAHARETVVPHIQRAVFGFGELLADVSMPPPPDAAIQMAQVFEFTLKPGGDEEFMNALVRFREAADRVSMPGNYLWVLSRSGGVANMTLAIPLQGFGDLAGIEGGPRSLLAAAFGEAEAGLVWDSMMNAIESVEELTYVFRPDLSYIPSGS